MEYPTLSRRFVGVSLKMYFDLHQTTNYVKVLNQSLDFWDEVAKNDTTVFIIPSSPTLPLLFQLMHHEESAWLGAQDCHWEDNGPYTGEVSPLMLQQLGCKIVELGHAERRRAPINETDDIVAKKAQAVVRNRMVPLICIGEKERSGNDSQAVAIAAAQCEVQIRAALDVLRNSSEGRRHASVLFAYEPVWAIGASEPASAGHVLAVIATLRGLVIREYGGDVRFLYGGSARPGTWQMLKAGCDGLFLGRFAHDANNFIKVVREVAV